MKQQSLLPISHLRTHSWHSWFSKGQQLGTHTPERGMSRLVNYVTNNINSNIVEETTKKTIIELPTSSHLTTKITYIICPIMENPTFQKTFLSSTWTSAEIKYTHLCVNCIVASGHSYSLWYKNILSYVKIACSLQVGRALIRNYICTNAEFFTNHLISSNLFIVHLLRQAKHFCSSYNWFT